ncbi:protein NRT1/ PTR FAMILY 2.10-like isoform X2 [Actinidia eriantha]|nr:protein NRT1/ PTR FAMILY 2.10-like isoform X2 [Actinidia eriantha]
MLILTLTAAISGLHPPPCGTNQCTGPTPWQVIFLASAFGFLVVGASGIRPCNLAFGADQFNPNTESGKRGISSFFNWYFFTFTFAMMVSLTVIVYVQSDVSWAWGLALPTFLMFLSCTFFFIGTRIYVMVIPQGSPLTSVLQVIVASAKKREVKFPEQPLISLYNHVPTNSINSKLPYTDQFRFLNKAAIVTPEDQIKTDGSAANPWRLCGIQQVEEVKCLLKALPIWAAGIIYYVTIVQQQTFVVFQALQSDRRLGSTSFKIPAASYTVFNMLSLTIWIPIYDRIIIPMLRKLTKKEDGITVLQKIGIGLGIAVVTMLVSALVEKDRRTLALTKPTLGVVPRKGAISSMSGLWLVAQLALAGLSEAFAIVGQVEFFYKQFPENMRSIGGSFLFSGLALSSYLSSFLVSIVHRVTEGDETGNWLTEDLNRGKLDYFYYLIAALQVLNLGYFVVCAKWYKYKGASANSLDVPLEKMQSEKSKAQNTNTDTSK